MSLDLTKNSAYIDKTPYEVWQETEGVPIYKGLAIDDLTTVAAGLWKRKGTFGAFINLLGAGRSCDSYVCEIPAQGQTLPERYLWSRDGVRPAFGPKAALSRRSNGKKAVCSPHRSTPGASISTFNEMSRRDLSP